MIDQIVALALAYGHFVLFAIAIAFYAYHWYTIIHFRNNPPWKTGPDLRGERRDVLGGLGEATRERRERGEHDQ